MSVPMLRADESCRICPLRCPMTPSSPFRSRDKIAIKETRRQPHLQLVTVNSSSVPENGPRCVARLNHSAEVRPPSNDEIYSLDELFYLHKKNCIDFGNKILKPIDTYHPFWHKPREHTLSVSLGETISTFGSFPISPAPTCLSLVYIRRIYVSIYSYWMIPISKSRISRPTREPPV